MLNHGIGVDAILSKKASISIRRYSEECIITSDVVIINRARRIYNLVEKS